MTSDRELHREQMITVLLSGGVDSAACAHFLLAHGYSVDTLFVDYGQPAAVHEKEASMLVAARLKVPWSFAVCSNPSVPEYGEIKARNLLLIALSMIYRPNTTAIGLGIHSGTSYYDCSQAFVDDIQRISDGYSGGHLRLLVPFLEWTKGDIYTYCKHYDVPIESTYSCERGYLPPCNNCDSCKDRNRANGLFSKNLKTQT